ncbi:sensor histidine kinase [Sphingomonas sp. GlSt437]|uniref:sensor histidine kinase n=1 Tax=Sphingomonas sp. GlSt437 TaxID=3389970 RepID=UPI003A8A9BAF
MRLWPRSLALRILVVEIIAVVAAIIILPLTAVALLRDASDIEQQRLLSAQAQSIAAAMDDREGAISVKLPHSLAAVFAEGYDGRGFLVIDAQGRVLAKSQRAAALPLTAIPRAAGARLFHSPPVVAISQPARVAGRRLWIVVSQNQAYPGAIVDDVTSRFLGRYIAVLVAALALLPLINAFAVRRLIRVVRRVSEQASTIGPYDLGKRLDDADLPLEIKGLVAATNRLIDRLALSLNRQRQFVSNLAHELRTPLATLQLEIDALEDRRAAKGLAKTIDRLAHVVSQMRDLAELETLDIAARVPVDLNEVAKQLAGELTPFVYREAHQIALETPSEPVRILGSRLLIELALRNLIVNAVQHTPAQTQISVTVTANGALTVSDNGPGLKLDDQALITERYWRADQDRSDTAGLGLSIVERICDVHGARLAIASSAEGGASFSLDFSRFEQGIRE